MRPSYGSDPQQTFLGRDFGQGQGYSETIAAEIDAEIRDIVDEAYETARRSLSEHMDELHKVAAALIEREKLSGEEFKRIMEGGELPPFDPPAAKPDKTPDAPAEAAEKAADPAPASAEGSQPGAPAAPGEASAPAEPEEATGTTGEPEAATPPEAQQPEAEPPAPAKPPAAEPQDP